MSVKTDHAWHQTAVKTAIVAGVFSVIAAGLLMVNQAQGKVTTLLDFKEMDSLKETLQKQPKDQILKKRIRTLDLQRRRDLFHRLRFSETGAYLLLIAVALLLAGAHGAAALRKKLPNPLQWGPRRAGEEQRTAHLTRRTVALCGVLVAASVLLLIKGSARPSVPTALDAFAGRLLIKGSAELSVPTAMDAFAGRSETQAGLPYPSTEEIRKNWPRFRGPGGLGVSAYTQIPKAWNGKSGAGILWKRPVPLPGKNSPLLWNGSIFVTGADQERNEVYRFDAETGTLLWRAAVKVPGHRETRRVEVSEETGYAAPTALIDGRRIYAVFANGDLAAFDLDGQQVWARNWRISDNPYGHTSSLAMFQDILLILLDQGTEEENRSKLVALDARTGKTVWERKRPVSSSWSSPIVIQPGGRHQLITTASPWVIAYDPRSGSELWRVNCLDGEIAPSPIYAGGLVIAVSPGDRLVAIRTDGRGDVTKSHIAWTAEGDIPDVCSPVSDGDRIYALTTDGVLSCYELESGKRLWQQELELYFYTSPSLVGNRLVLFADDGAVVMIEAGNEYRELGRAEMGEQCFACPAFGKGRIYVRGEKHLSCIGNAE